MPNAQSGVPGKFNRVNLRVKEITSAGYTLTDDDLLGQVLLVLNNGAAQNLTINTGLIGTEPVTLFNKGVGLWSVAAGGGVTLQAKGAALSLSDQFSWATIVPDPTAAETYLIGGDLS